jgi:hypothetical protein
MRITMAVTAISRTRTVTTTAVAAVRQVARADPVPMRLVDPGRTQYSTAAQVVTVVSPVRTRSVPPAASSRQSYPVAVEVAVPMTVQDTPEQTA